ncbi:Fructokinase [Globisporangium polare]
MLWTDLFVPASPTKSTTSAASAPPPRLGIDYVKASASEASIPIFTTTSSDSSQHESVTPATTMVIQQNLSAHGIAGVVWNCRQPHLLAKKRVLELGAGTGAVGLALALSSRGLASLVLTDLESVVPLTTQNMHIVAREHAQIRSMLDRKALSTQGYCWGDAVSEALIGHADVILCSDCLYEPSQYSNLLESLVAVTGRQEEKAGDNSVLVLIAYKQRIPEREKAFFESASEFFQITIEAVDGNTCPAVGSDTIYICKLERLSGAPQQES